MLNSWSSGRPAVAVATVLCAASTLFVSGQVSSKRTSSDLRLYVFDCGYVRNIDTWSAFGFDPAKIANTTDAACPCHLIVHPKGTLVWDAGTVPDDEIGKHRVRVDGAVPAGGTATTFVATKPLRQQLAEVGYTPEEITYFALSHYHIDHAANANMFKGSTWLVRRAERDYMFAPTPRGVRAARNAAHYSELKNSRTIIVEPDVYDVFGDGRVQLMATPGHTPGHQVLVLKLAKTGPVMLAGDLYHYPEERRLGWIPIPLEFDVEQSRASRAAIEAYVKATATQLWIEHDYVANSKLKKSPAYYD
jgi:N-acyl homoserine lactone hydrolase